MAESKLPNWRVQTPNITVPSQQFFDIGAFEEGSFNSYQDIANQAKRNPKFAWPKPYYKNTNGDVVELQRGYIRLLSPGSTASPSGASGVPRCFFQFNPDSITRGITARNDVQLWVNQDPGQLGQPMYGDQNFSFELLFNREMEVAANTTTTSLLGTNDPGNALESVPTRDVNTSDVGQTGVLADLAMLDAIIGVGLSLDTYEYQVRQYNEQQRYNAEQEAKSTANSDGSSSVTEDYPQIAVDREFYQANIGNKAFLMPNPIRVIFSRLFMLDGYIQSVQVTFNKFSASMIPTQCSVAIQMQALYFGFAQPTTMLTRYVGGQTSGGATGGTGGTGSGGTSTTINPEILQLRYIPYLDEVRHSNGGSEKISEFNNAGGNKISFEIKFNRQFEDWVRRNTTPKPTAYLSYRVLQNGEELFSSKNPIAARDQTNLEISNTTASNPYMFTANFYMTRPETFANGLSYFLNNATYTIECQVHVDLDVGNTTIRGVQNANFVKSGVGLNQGFDLQATNTFEIRS